MSPRQINYDKTNTHLTLSDCVKELLISSYKIYNEIIPDSKYESEIIAKFMNQLMVDGKKSIAESIVYGAFEQLEKDSKGEDPVEVFKKILALIYYGRRRQN